MINNSVEFHFNKVGITLRVDNVIVDADDETLVEDIACGKLKELGIDINKMAEKLECKYWVEIPYSEVEG